MTLLPRDPDKRWNLVIASVAVVFTMLVALVIVSTIWGKNADIQDDALFIGAVGGFTTLLLNQIRHGAQMNKTQDTIEQVYQHVNNVEEREALLSGIDKKLDELLERER